MSQLNTVKISNTCAFSSFIFSHVTSSYTNVSSVVFDTLLLSAFSKIKEKIPKTGVEVNCTYSKLSMFNFFLGMHSSEWIMQRGENYHLMKIHAVSVKKASRKIKQF